MRQKGPNDTTKNSKHRTSSRFLFFLCSSQLGLPYSLSRSSFPPSLPLFILVKSQPLSPQINVYKHICALVCTRYSFYCLAVLSAVQSKRMKWCSHSLSFILRQYKTPYWKVDKLWNSPWYSGLRQQSMDKPM